MTDYVVPVVIFAMGVTAYAVYTHFKIKELEIMIGNFPTPQELAREIVKVKIPIEDLPPDLKAMLKKNEERDLPDVPPIPVVPSTPPTRKDLPSYIN